VLFSANSWWDNGHNVMKKNEFEIEKHFIDYLVKTVKQEQLSSLELKRTLAEKHTIEIKINNSGTFSNQQVKESVETNFNVLNKDVSNSNEGTPDILVNENIIKSPMVGTVYLSPSPEEPAFIHVGKKISKGDTILIIEAMKTMNHIPSTVDGTVKEILVNNESPVEFDTPLVMVE
jgi:acetyl-CoA carboxylase biotin carboxyl carrier protein